MKLSGLSREVGERSPIHSEAKCLGIPPVRKRSMPGQNILANHELRMQHRGVYCESNNRPRSMALETITPHRPCSPSVELLWRRSRSKQLGWSLIRDVDEWSLVEEGSGRRFRVAVPVDNL
jgi:hypothetical protein